MPVSLCCVPDCNYKAGTVRHRFPVYVEHEFKIWVQSVGHPKFKEMDDLQVYKNYFVCDRHFSEDSRSPGTKNLIEDRFQIFIYRLVLVQKLLARVPYSVEVSVYQCVRTQVLITSCPSSGDATLCSDAIVPSEINPTSGNKQNGLLRSVKVSQAKFLTPKARNLYSSAKLHKRKVMLLSKRCSSLKQRIKKAAKFAEDIGFKKLLSSVSSTSELFIRCQIRNQTRHPKGRRFTGEEKIICLALLKQAGNRGYRLLSMLFALPTRRSLSKMLQHLPLKPGLSANIFEHLHACVKKMKPRDKYCTLIFDEMAMSPGLSYKPSEDEIQGFRDLGNGDRQQEFADHALVFMMRGVHRKWKQPISFMFVKGTVKAVDLVRILKSTIRTVLKTGLKVVATVCDQGSTNVSAMNVLFKETRELYLRKGEEKRSIGFEIDGINVIHIYDPPHLLKGVRNNLLKGNLYFTENGKVKIAKWQHVIDFYHIDISVPDENRRMCPKLTAEHVLPNQIKKMKVKCCSQVFSHRVSSIMRKLAQWSRFIPKTDLKNGKEKLEVKIDETTKTCKQSTLACASTEGECSIDPAAENTDDLLPFMDELFDSANGTSVLSTTGKTLQCAVSKNSRHSQFWGTELCWPQ